MTTVINDVDIEVQDVLDNNQIHTLQLDLCCIKEEVPDEESNEIMTKAEEDIEIEEYDVLSNPWTSNLVLDPFCIKEDVPDEEAQGHTNNNELLPDTELMAVTEQLYGSEIIEPNFGKTNANVDDEVVDFIESIKDEAPYLEEEIIPSVAGIASFEDIDNQPEVTVTEGMNRVDIKIFRSLLVCLEDCGQRLFNNPLFCNQCKILFPASNRFLDHDMSAHSLLVVREYKNIKSTSKVISKKTDIVNKSNDQKFKNNTIVRKLRQTKNSEQKQSYCFKKDNTETRNSTSCFYRCNVCHYYLKFRNNITSHMSTNHSLDRSADAMKTEPFDSKCKFCSSFFQSVKAYNRHIKLKHTRKFMENVNKPVKNIHLGQKTIHNEIITTKRCLRQHKNMLPSKNKLNLRLLNKNVTCSSSKDNMAPTPPKLRKYGRLNSTASMTTKADSNNPTTSTNRRTKRRNPSPSPKRKTVSRRQPRTPSTMNKAKSHNSSSSLNGEANKSSKPSTKSRANEPQSSIHSMKHKAVRPNSPTPSTRNKADKSQGSIPSKINIADKHHSPNRSTRSKTNRPERPIPLRNRKANLPDSPSEADWSQCQIISRPVPQFWNILYRCSTCDIIHDNYDYVVEHCQKHINNIETHGIVVKYCEICCLKFDSSCFDEHKELHEKNEINKESFRIFSYSYELLLRQNWLSFIKLPKNEVEQIIANSIYAYTRKVKMRLVKDGYPESTIAKCLKCLKHVSPRSVYIHSQAHGCNKYRGSFVCWICRLKFSTSHTLSEHLALHRTFTRFKTVYFNEKGDESFNENLFIQDSKENCEFKANSVHYYKCQYCQRCVYNIFKKHKHVCGVDGNQRCEKCGLLFTYGLSYYRHLRIHKLNPQLSKKDIIISEFIPRSKQKVIQQPEEQPQNSVNKIHNELQSPKKTVRPSTLQNRPNRGNVNFYTKELFRCELCEVHFTRRESLISHFRKNDYHKIIQLRKCGICKYNFPKTVFNLHQHFHHKLMGLKREDFVIVTSQGSIITHSEVTNEVIDLDELLTNAENISEKKSKVLTTDESGREGDIDTMVNEKISVDEDMNAEVDNSQSYDTSEVGAVNTINKMTDEHPKRKSIEFHDNSKVEIVFSDTLFRCEKCNLNFMTLKHLKDHSRRCCDRIVKKITCDKCGLLFNRTTFPNHFREHHVKLNLTADDIKILNLNYELIINKPDTERHDQSVDSDPALARKNGYDDSEISFQRGSNNNIDTDSENSKSLFKCHFCGLHYLEQTSLVRHECQFLSVQRNFCDECDLEFGADTIMRHRLVHHLKMGLKLEDFKIFVSGKDMDKTNDQTKKSIRLPEILRRNNKLKLKQIIRSSEAVEGDDCSSKTTTSSYVDEYSDETRSLYMCHFCRLHYMGHNSFVLHECQYLSVQRTDCDECGLEFSTEIIMTHKFVHHQNMGLKLEDFEIIVSGNDGQIKTKSKNSN